MQAGDDPTGWAQTSARLRASLLPDQLLAEEDGEGSHRASAEHDAQQESSAESAAGAAQKGASAKRDDGKERELQEPEAVENGFLARLSGLSGQSSGHSSAGSDSRSLTGQPSGHSSMHSIPEGKPESCINHCLLYRQVEAWRLFCAYRHSWHRILLASTEAVTCRIGNLRVSERQPVITLLHPPWAAPQPFPDVTPAATAGSEAPADPGSSHLTSYAVRLSPAQTHSSSQLSPRSSGPAQTWSGAGDGGQWQPGDSVLSSSPARGVSRTRHHLRHTAGPCRLSCHRQPRL